MAASNDDSVVAHSSLPAASRISPSSVVCSTTPLAQTFPQLAQHVVERGALTHSHDSELCSQRGSLSALLASLCSLPRFRSPRFTNSGTAHGRSASSKKGSSAAATVWTRSASTSEPVREAACRGIAKRRVRGDKRYKKHKETRTPPPPSPLPANAKNFECPGISFVAVPPRPSHLLTVLIFLRSSSLRELWMVLQMQRATVRTCCGIIDADARFVALGRRGLRVRDWHWERALVQH